jgi:hypothetical protein
MRTKLFLFTVGLAFALIASGCNKKSSNPVSPTTTSNAPVFPAVVIKGPNTTSNDLYAQETKGYAASVNTLTTPVYLGLVAGVNPTENGNAWTWTATQGNFTVTATANKQADGSYTWSLTLNGTESGSSTTYNNWVAFTGTASADGKSGDFKAYDDNTTTLTGDFVWSTNASGTLTATLTSYTNGAADGKMVIVNNADNSGELDAYTGTVLTFKSTWIASGAGSWWTYDNSTGAQIGTGSWT